MCYVTEDLYDEYLLLMEARARRAAKLVGLVARKSRRWVGTIDNQGGFALLSPVDSSIIAGERFDLSPEDVIEICTPDAEE